MNGFWNHYATTTPATTAAANTLATLLSRNIASGAVDDGNMLVLRSEFSGLGTANFKVNGTTLLAIDWPINGSSEIVHLEVWRVGRYGALVRPWSAGVGTVADDPMALRHGGRYVVSTGLDWQAQQTIEVVGQSPNANGLTLDRAGIAK